MRARIANWAFEFVCALLLLGWLVTIVVLLAAVFG